MLPDCDFRPLVGPTTVVAAGAAQTAYVDTQGWDYMIIVGSDGIASSSVTPIRAELRLSAGPTTMSAFTDGTPMVAFEGGTVVDATHGFIIEQTPSTASTAVNGFVLKVDLKGVDRYVCIEQQSNGTNIQASYALMFRADEQPEAAVSTTTLSRARNVVAG